MTKNSRQSVRNFLLWESFNRTNKQLFFGRDREAKVLYDKTFASNLLLLYGPSGAGKTSLVRCGLGNMFEKSDWYPIFIRKGDNIVRSLSAALKNASEDPSKMRNSSIRDKIHELFLEKFRPIFLIFDQFEELFILGNREEQDHFFNLLLDLANANFQCKIILSIKEDFLADLDTYEEAIPMLFYNRMRVERMRTEQLEEVVRGMTSNMRINLGGPDDDEVEQQRIIDSIFENVRDDTNRIDLGELQLFLDELYAKDEERQAEEGDLMRQIQFDRPLVEAAEYVDVIISRRLQKQLEDLDLKFKQKAEKERLPHLILRELVTELETKRARSVEDIEKNLFDQHKVLPEYIEECIQMLIDTGIVRNLAISQMSRRQLKLDRRHKVEIVHDNLAKKLYPLLFSEEQNIIRVKNFIAIQHETFEEAGVKLSKDDLEYIQPYLAQIKKDIPSEHISFVEISRQEVRKKDLRLAIFLVGLSLFLLASTVLSIWQWSVSSRKSEANNISAKALGALEYDRTLALRLAELAQSKDPDNLLANQVMNDVVIDMANFPFYQHVYRIDTKQSIDRISDMDVSDNGRYLVAGGLDGHLYLLSLWDDMSIPKQLEIDSTIRHRSEITDVDLLDNVLGIRYSFLTSSKDGTVKHWEIKNDGTTSLVHNLDHKEPLSAVTLKKINDELLVFTAGDQYIKKWLLTDSTSELAIRDSFHLQQTTAFEIVKFNQEHFLIAAHHNDTTISITPLSAGASTQKVTLSIPEGSPVVSMDFIKDSGHAAATTLREYAALGEGLFVAGLEDGQLICWSLSRSFLNGSRKIEDSDFYRSREAHTQAIKDVIFIDNDEQLQLLTSSEDKSAKLWNTELDVIKTFLGHNDGVKTISSEEGGEIIYTGGVDKTIKKWELEMIPIETRDDRNVISMNYLPKQRSLFVRKQLAGYPFIQYQNYEENPGGEDIGLYDASNTIAHVAFSPDGAHTLMAIQDKPGVQLLEMLDREPIQTIWPKAKQEEITGLAFSQDSKFALIMCRDSTVIWQREGDEYRSGFTLNERLSQAALFSQDNQLLLIGAVQNEIKLWNISLLSNAGHKVRPVPREDPLDHHTGDVLTVALSSDGRYLLSGSEDNSFIFGSRIQTDEAFTSHRVQRHTSDVSAVAFSPDLKRFLTASRDGEVRLWNMEAREEKSHINHGAPVVEALFLSEHIIITLGTDGRIRIWDIEDIANFIEEKSEIGRQRVHSLTEEEKDSVEEQ